MLRNLAIGTLLCAGVVSIAHADVFRWVDDRGSVHYSDQWVPGSEVIKSSPKPPGGGPDKTPHVDVIIAQRRQLTFWAEDCEENFCCQIALIDAELARLDGRELEAERHYDAAIGFARDHRFTPKEALASELAGRFQLARGLENTGIALLCSARDAYERWGALGKVQQLGEEFRRLRADTSVGERE